MSELVCANMFYVLGFLLFLLNVPRNTVSDCNWPANLQNSIWHDSDKGQLHFETKTMSGFAYVFQNTITVNNWDCLYFYQNSSILIMKSQETVTVFNTVYRPFQCLKLAQITDYSYYYYIQADTEIRFANERIVLQEDTTATAINESIAESTLCEDLASDTEYHFLLKDNQEENAAQACPGSFRNEFWYVINDGGATSCGSQNERWDVCTDTTTMAFDYSMCSTQIAYSSSGIVRCMATLTTGNFTLTTVMNTDSSPTYMFTCFMSQVSSSGILLVSQSPKSCTSSQTPTTQPVHPDGTKGLLLELRPHATSACGK
ncbi:uncharacterized protein LOC123557085 isoform X2 [Mercenaria mercenaria]|uniref:uncharacterized protein LOC123557085 isoform X2 n=1 Tax=Mercenaria mercenaria TaxID=6596 RepID=UPI00234E47EC|nr:uncharacterized protein LOC123557085 isoform X2 [Mercenaria mercenaria]